MMKQQKADYSTLMYQNAWKNSWEYLRTLLDLMYYTFIIMSVIKSNTGQKRNKYSRLLFEYTIRPKQSRISAKNDGRTVILKCFHTGLDFYPRL